MSSFAVPYRRFDRSPQYRFQSLFPYLRFFSFSYNLLTRIFVHYRQFPSASMQFSYAFRLISTTTLFFCVSMTFMICHFATFYRLVNQLGLWRYVATCWSTHFPPFVSYPRLRCLRVPSSPARGHDNLMVSSGNEESIAGSVMCTYTAGLTCLLQIGARGLSAF